MALTSDVLAKQMGSKAEPPSIKLVDGKVKLIYPSVQSLPPSFVNTVDLESYRNLVSIRAFVSSASESIRSSDNILPSPTTKALLNETILELNTALSEGLKWHNSAMEAQSLGAILSDSGAYERAMHQVKATFFIYLAYVMKEIVGEVMRSNPQT
jgi:hypothetical protein